jgi:hypothetical protein
LEVSAPTKLNDALSITGHQPIEESPDNVEEQDQEDKESKETKEAELTSLPDLDEALSDVASSSGNDPALAGSPSLQDLVCLGQEHCRLPCTIKNNDGVNTVSESAVKDGTTRSY